MKRIMVALAISLFLAGHAFSEVYLQGSVGILYVSFLSPEQSAMPAELGLRTGLMGDLLFPAGRFDLGVGIGLYAMPLDFLIFAFTMLEVPMDVIIRANLTPNRVVALELRAGGWLRSYTVSGFGESATASGVAPHAGLHLVIGPIYLGGDLCGPSTTFLPAFSFWAGYRVSGRFETKR